jgi:hypothetical protein
MPDTTILYDAEGNEVQVETESPNVRQMREQIKQLEAEAQRAKDLEAQLATTQRLSALTAAGLELDETKRAALEAVHQGDWTPDAVKQTAISLGWAQAENQPTAEEIAAQARMAAAQSGGGAPVTDAEALLEAKLAEAKSPAEFMEIYRTSGRPLS